MTSNRYQGVLSHNGHSNASRKHPATLNTCSVQQPVPVPGVVYVPGEVAYTPAAQAAASVSESVWLSPSDEKRIFYEQAHSSAYNEVPTDYGRRDINVMGSSAVETRGVKVVKK